MSVTEIETEADRIALKMIEICNKNMVNNRSIIDIFNETIKEEMKEKKIEILSYIPEQLARKKYDIVETSPLKLEEY